MKKIFFILFSLTILTNCNVQYFIKSWELIKDKQVIINNIFSDDNVEITITPRDSWFNVSILNKTDNSIILLHDKCGFANEKNISKIVFSYRDLKSKLKNSVILPNTRIYNELFPYDILSEESNILFINQSFIKIVDPRDYEEVLPDESVQITNYIDKKLLLLISLEIKEQIVEYLFQIKIKSIGTRY